MFSGLSKLEEDKVQQLIIKLCLRLSEIPFPEPCEELRKIILLTMIELIKSYPNAVKNSLKEITKMLSKVLVD